MTRYFLNTDDDLPRDVVGFEAANLADAKCAAVRRFSSIMATTAASYWEDHDADVTLADASGHAIFSVSGTEGASLREQNQSRGCAFTAFIARARLADRLAGFRPMRK